MEAASNQENYPGSQLCFVDHVSIKRDKTQLFNEYSTLQKQDGCFNNAKDVQCHCGSAILPSATYITSILLGISLKKACYVSS